MKYPVRTVFLKFLPLCPLIMGVARADTFILDERHTFPSFEVSHLGFSTQRGRFDKTTGSVLLDTERKTGSMQVTIHSASIDTGLTELEDKLRSTDFFNTAQFPEISYQADKIEFVGDQPKTVSGNLTLLGVTRPLILTIDHYQCGFHPIYLKTVCGVDVSGTL
ncbi:MAG: YceI family protein, partial [Methylococcaceae bacterium]